MTSTMMPSTIFRCFSTITVQRKQQQQAFQNFHVSCRQQQQSTKNMNLPRMMNIRNSNNNNNIAYISFCNLVLQSRRLKCHEIESVRIRCWNRCCNSNYNNEIETQLQQKRYIQQATTNRKQFYGTTSMCCNSSLDQDMIDYFYDVFSDQQQQHDDVVTIEMMNAILKSLRPVYGTEIKVKHLQEFGRPGMIALLDAVKHEQKQQMQKLNTSTSNNNTTRLSSNSIQLKIKIPHHKIEFYVKWKMGQSFLDIVQDHPELLGEYIEGTCGGTMSCCTCHIYVDYYKNHNGDDNDETLSRYVPPVSESELDMLDLAYEPIEERSRLGCQIKLTPMLLEHYEELVQKMNRTESSTTTSTNLPKDLITITIPPGVNNFWNDTM